MRGKLLKGRLFAGFLLLPTALSGCTGGSDKEAVGAGGVSNGGAAAGGVSGGTIELGGAASGGLATGGAEVGGAVSSGGNAPSGGASGNGGGGTGGGGSECPAQIPAERTACGQVQACYYSDCAARGRVTAICYGHEFTITATPCDQVTVNCGSTDCAPGQICVEAYSGAASSTCMDNPCGSHALGCDCAAKLCETGWSCSTQAFSVRCSSPCTMCP